MDTKDDDELDTGQAASFLGLNEDTLRKWRSRKHLAAVEAGTRSPGPDWVRHGGRIVYRRSALLEWKKGKPNGRVLRVTPQAKAPAPTEPTEPAAPTPARKLPPVPTRKLPPAPTRKASSS